MVARARLEHWGSFGDPRPGRGLYGLVRLRAASRGRGASRPRLIGRATGAGSVPVATIERFPLAAPRAALRVVLPGALLGASPRERPTPFEKQCQQERGEKRPNRRDRDHADVARDAGSYEHVDEPV